MIALKSRPSTKHTTASGNASPQRRGEQRPDGAAGRPAEHLLWRPHALAEEQVGDERRNRTGRNPGAQAERDTGDDRDDRHGLNAGKRREQNASGCGR